VVTTNRELSGELLGADGQFRIALFHSLTLFHQQLLLQRLLYASTHRFTSTPDLNNSLIQAQQMNIRHAV